HGLFVLYPSPGLPPSEEFKVDIIAVHGLNGTLRGTWTDKAANTLWLEDFLSSAIPDARIMTFGYDSKLMLSHSRDSIEDFATELLNQIWMLRLSQKDKCRLLVFIAHSLGGIVVKKAIILAHGNNHHYGHIASSTIGIVFLATPHQGSDLTRWASLLTLISKNRLIRSDLIDTLKPQSSVLSQISKSFLPRSSDLAIMSFVEKQVEPRLLVLVVPEESAKMGVPNEMVFPVQAHHRSICRYSSRDDPTYVLVVASLKMMMEKQLSQGAHLKLASSYGDSHTLNIRVNGLKGKITATERGWIPRCRVLTIPGTMEYEHIMDTLQRADPGDLSETSNLPDNIDIVIPNKLRFCGRPSDISSIWHDCFTISAQVTKNQPCYKVEMGRQISMKQTIASFFSKVFPDPITARLKIHQIQTESGTGESHCISVGQNNIPAIEISIMRTSLVEGDIRLQPPKGLRTFPLFNTQAYKDKLPIKAATRGGLFLPMHDHEAMFISLNSRENYNYRHSESRSLAVHPFIGRMNIITGQQLFSDNPRSTDMQDYIIAPKQHRLDGIAVRRGMVKQFVTSNLKPSTLSHHTAALNAPSLVNSLPEVNSSKKTVKWQMSGKDEYSSMQLQVIPQFKLEHIFARNIKDVCSVSSDGHLESYRPIPDNATRFNVLKTPEELGLCVGDVIYIKNLSQRHRPRGRVVRDLFSEAPKQSDILDMKAVYDLSDEITLSIRCPGSEHGPIILFKVQYNPEPLSCFGTSIDTKSAYTPTRSYHHGGRCRRNYRPRNHGR
ncbi:hypothetical protein BBK36DRAFT_1121948, partial [Trichoderma citrinoviride]